MINRICDEHEDERDDDDEGDVRHARVRAVTTCGLSERCSCLSPQALSWTCVFLRLVGARNLFKGAHSRLLRKQYAGKTCGFSLFEARLRRFVALLRRTPHSLLAGWTFRKSVRRPLPEVEMFRLDSPFS